MIKIKITIFLFLLFSTLTLAIEQQRATNWCWAACIQDVVFQKTGWYQSQFQISARLTGWPQNRPAYIYEVVNLVRSYGLAAWQAGRPGTPQELYNTLVSGWKVIAFVRPTNGSVGHFIVLQGFDNNGNIVISDPASGLTYTNSLNQIYYAWRWFDSVVVG